MNALEREKFEEYCLNRNIDPKSLWGLSILDGWNARQPEIDALNAAIDDLALQKGILKAEIGRLTDEVERLRQVKGYEPVYLVANWSRGYEQTSKEKFGRFEDQNRWLLYKKIGE